MGKKILGFSVAICLISNLFACQNQNTFPLIDNQDNITISAKKTKTQLKNNWYENLSPELQYYYAPAQGKTGNDLFNAIHDIIARDNRMESYTSTRAFLFSKVDSIFNRKNLPGVLDSYSQIFIPGLGEFGEGYKEIADENKDGYPEDTINAEHTWPQSFYGKSLPMVSDMHALQTVLSIPNVMRSDFPFGEVTKDISYTTLCGSKLSVLDSQGKPVSYKRAKPLLDKQIKNSKITKTTEPTNEYKGIFEPCNPQKGNTARNMLYFYIRYHDMSIKQGSYDDLTFWKSKVKMFINWSENIDPVDSREKLRNDLIFQKQNNRNPFVDIPYLASIIGEEPFLKN